KSQSWRTAADVDRTQWQHWMQIIVPSGPVGSTALMLIDGGSNSATPPQTPSADLVAAALLSHTVAVRMPQVPNEPLTFSGDPNNPRTEDEIIAYSFDKFMDNIGKPGN